MDNSCWECVYYIISIFAVVAGGGWALWNYWSSKKREKKQATLQAYNRLQQEVMDDLYCHYPPAQIRRIALNNRSDEYRKLSTLIARIEHFCVGIHQDIYDKDVLRELAGGFFDGAIKSRIQPIIEKKNENGVNYYSNICWVYEQLATKNKRSR